MERTFVIVVIAALGLACSSVDERGGCSASADCPAGQYCAHTGDGNVCWADAVAPVVTGVAASCAEAGGCRRDSLLRVTATVTEATSDVLDATVALDLPGGLTVPMARDGAQWKADVDLRRFPFEHFERSVVATVTARDGARNVSEVASAAGVSVTRLRWTYDARAPITSPAIKDDGTLVVGRSASSEQLLAIQATGEKAWSCTVGSAYVSAAPAIGEDTIWVGSEDFTLYGVELDGSSVKAGLGVNAGGGIKGSVAVLFDGSKEFAFATSDGGFASVASTTPSEYAIAGPTGVFSVGPVVALDGRVYAATTTGSLRAYRLNTSPALTLTDVWSAAVGVDVSASVAVDAAGAIWTGAIEKLGKTVPGDTTGTFTSIATLPARIVDSPVIHATGDVIVGDQTGLLHRFTSAGDQVWSVKPNLGAPATAAMLLAGGDASILVPTAGGKVYALRGDGTEVWSTTIDAGKSLRPANLYTPAGQTGAAMSTAYVASASGKLFAVVVDGQLDASAPWPKAFHDPRNTNRAGPQP